MFQLVLQHQALGDNDPKWQRDYENRTTSGAFDDWMKAMILPVLLPKILNCQKDLILKKLETPFKLFKVITLEAQT